MDKLKESMDEFNGMLDNVNLDINEKIELGFGKLLDEISEITRGISNIGVEAQQQTASTLPNFGK